MNSKARRILSLAVSISLLPIVGCSTNTAKKDGSKSDAVHIKITLTNNKEIEADLYPHIAPKSVENFVNLINQNFFDGLIFHRVIEGFMIQGGGYDESFYEGNFTSKETNTITEAPVAVPEVYVDANSNKAYDAGETFTDVNGNGVWDAAAIPTGYSTTTIGQIAWGFTVSRPEDLAARGIKTSKFDTLDGEEAANGAQYALALIVDDKVVEIYEILAD